MIKSRQMLIKFHPLFFLWLIPRSKLHYWHGSTQCVRSLELNDLLTLNVNRKVEAVVHFSGVKAEDRRHPVPSADPR